MSGRLCEPTWVVGCVSRLKWADLVEDKKWADLVEDKKWTDLVEAADLVEEKKSFDLVEVTSGRGKKQTVEPKLSRSKFSWVVRPTKIYKPV